MTETQASSTLTDICWSRACWLSLYQSSHVDKSSDRASLAADHTFWATSCLSDWTGLAYKGMHVSLLSMNIWFVAPSYSCKNISCLKISQQLFFNLLSSYVDIIPHQVYLVFGFANVRITQKALLNAKRASLNTAYVLNQFIDGHYKVKIYPVAKHIRHASERLFFMCNTLWL